MNQEGFIISEYLQSRVKDELFDVDLLGQFDLCIQISDSAFNFCVVDTQTQRCLMLEAYKIPSTPGKTFKDHLQVIFEDHHFLMAGYWKSVKISTFNKQFSLVPYPLFDESVIKRYLEIVAPYNLESDSLYHYKHNMPDTVSVFAVNLELMNWIKGFYPEQNVKVIHQTSALIEGVMKDQQSMSLKSMYLFVDKSYFTLVVKNENTLEYCNIFSYSTPEEFFFYLIFVVSTLNITRKSTKLMLFGDINDSIINRINDQFKFVTYGAKPSYLKYGYVFDEIPEHYFFDLFSIYLC